MTSSALDATDRALLVALSQDGRESAAALAKTLGLSRQAVTERIRNLERTGVIRGYRADIDPAALGLGVRAHLRLAVEGTQASSREKELVRRLVGNPMVRSIHRVSGEDCFVVELICREIADVTAILADLQSTRALQSSRTSFVLEVVMDRSGLGPLDAVLVGVPAPRGGR